MFKIPTTGGSRERAGLASRREKVQLAAMIVAVLAMLGWWAARRARKAARRPPEVSYAIEDMAEQERTSHVKRADVMALMEKDRRKAAVAQGEEAARNGLAQQAPEEERVEPGLAPWRPRGADEIAPEEYRAMIEEERVEEAERAKFLPMLEEFKPLEPDAVRVYRAKIIDRVPSQGKPVLVLPAEPGIRYTAEKADGRGLTASRPDGTERKFTWDEIPVESLYALGKQIAVVEGPRANEKDAFFLAQLAVLAGEPEDAEGYFKRTVEIKPELAGKLRREPTTSLDYRVLDLYSGSFDDPTRPWEATSVREDAPSIFHVYRYMRTTGPEGLSEVVEPPTRYELLKRRPLNHRWRVYTIKGRFIRRYKSTRWTGIEGHKGAGIQDLDFCYIRGAKWSGVYLVSVPKDTRKFGSSDMVRFTGVYVRRWPYLKLGEWEWIPWIAAFDMEKVEIASSKGTRIVGIAVLVAVVLGVVIVFLYARRESRAAAKARELRTLRQRSQRDRIRRKAAESSKGEDASEGGKADADKGGDESKKSNGAGDKPASDEKTG